MDWYQTANPLSGLDADMSPTGIILESGDSGISGFGGLSISKRPDYFLDGEVGKDQWFTIGPNMHKIPAYFKNGKGSYAEKAELYINIEGKILSFFGL